MYRCVSDDARRSLERYEPRSGAESATLSELAACTGAVLRADGAQFNLDVVRRRGRQSRVA